MAITVDYVVFPHLRKKDGTNLVRIRVTNNRQSKYIKTSIVLEPEDMTRSGNIRNQGKKDRATEEVKDYREIVSSMPSYATDTMTIDEIVRWMKAKKAEGKEFRLNFASYGMQLADRLKEGTGKNYKVAIRCLVRYFGHEPDISEITVRAMRGFEDFIRNEKKMVYHSGKGLVEGEGKKGDRVVNMYTGVVRTIYKSARMEFNDPDLGIMRIPIDIFEYYRVPAPPIPEHRDIPMEWVQMMIDQRSELEGIERIAVDSFLISFALMGINSVDMYCANERIKDGVLHYFRAKTTMRKDDRAEMYVRIEPCVECLIKPYLDKNMPFIYHRLYANERSFNRALNKGLRRWIMRNELDKEFTFYSARHTWATIAASKDVGIDYAIVTEGLTHSDASRAMDKIYIRKDWERIWDANAKVLGLFRWE